MNQSSTIYSALRAEASRGGFVIGAMWLASFIFVTTAFTDPTLGLLGHVCALLSIVQCARMVRHMRVRYRPISFVHCLWYAWSTCFFATLLTTFGQFVYFQWFDNGRFIQGFIHVLENPVYRQHIQEMYPEGFSFDEVIEAASTLTVSQIVPQLLLTNLFCTTGVAIVSAAMGMLGKIQTEATK